MGENGRGAPLAVEVARPAVVAEERADRLLVARVVTHASLEVGHVDLVAHDGARGRGSGHAGQIDLDAQLRLRLRERGLQLPHPGFERRDAALEGERADVRRWLDRRERGGPLRPLWQLLADDDAVLPLVGGLERLLEPTQARAIEAERVGHPVEPRPLFRRDDAVLDDLREQLLVIALEAP